MGRGLTEFSNYAELCTFCRMGLHSSKRYFFLREVSTAHTCAGGEHTHRAFHIRCYIITAGHGRRPAMRVSERVRPTADLTPRSHLWHPPSDTSTTASANPPSHNRQRTTLSGWRSRYLLDTLRTPPPEKSDLSPICHFQTYSE